MALTVSGGERALTGELLLGLVTIFVATVRKQRTLPNPQQFAGLVIVFLFLSAMSAFGTSAAKLAGAFGMLVLTVILVAYAPYLFSATTAATTTPVHLDNSNTVKTTNA